MTGPASCLRCDWEGATDAATCPNCGAPLYRVTTPAPASRVERPAAPAGGDPTPAPEGRYLPSDRALADSHPVRRSRPFALTVLAALAVTFAVWWFLRAHEVPVPAPAAAPSPSGVLVYTTGEPGRQQLWSLDLAGDVATAGPFISQNVLELVNAGAALDGWVGVTTLAGDGSQRAGILRTQTPESHLVPLLGGDLVAWGPHGEGSVAATIERSSGACGRALVLRRADTESGVVERVFDEPDFCGQVRSIDEDVASTYLTLQRHGRVGVSSIGNGSPHRALAGYELLSMSPTADMLVRPQDGGVGASLFWRNAVEPRPYVYEGQPLVIDDVLAWTAAADGALVVGRAGYQQGLFEIDTTPGGDDVPRFVGLAKGPASAAAAGDGSIYLVMGSRLHVVRDGRMSDIALPVDAPAPSGPVAWLPG